MKHSLQLILGLFLSILTSSVATAQTAELRSLSPQDVRQLQIDLTQVGRAVGFASGEMNAATEQAFIEFADEQNLSSTDFTRVMQRLTARAERARWNEVKHFFDDFSDPAFRSDETRSRNYWRQRWSGSSRHYHPTNEYRPYANFQPYQYVEEENGNTYMRIEAMNGMNVQQPGVYKDECASVTIWDWWKIDCDTEADKFELTVRDDLRKPFQGVIEKELWVGFRIREGEIFETHPQAYSNIMQIKAHPWGQLIAMRVSADNGFGLKVPISKAPFAREDMTLGEGTGEYIEPTALPWRDAESYWRYNSPEENGFFSAPPVVATFGCQRPYMSMWTIMGNDIEDMVGINPLPSSDPETYAMNSETWTTYKIGIFHTKRDDGFVVVYRNDEPMFQYCGPTRRGSYRPDRVDVRIGFYRSHNPNVNLEQVVHYDDLTVVGSKAMLDAYLGYGNLGPNGVPQ